MNEWKPTKKQAQLLSLPTTIKEGVLGGGAGSGKTELLMLYGILHKWHLNPRFKQVFLRRTAPELKREVWPRSFEFYRKFGATPNKTDLVWTFPRPDQYGSGWLANDGAQIWFGHCEHETDVHIYDSMEINLFTPEEMTTLTEYIYLYIGFERTRAPLNSGLPAIIRGAAVPGNEGHTWVNKRFPKLLQEKFATYDFGDELPPIIEGKGGNKRFYVHATAADNEFLDPNYKQSLAGLPEAEKRAKLYGDWSAYLGQVFDEFRDKRYPDEPDEALHVVPGFEIPSWWPRIFVLDWGYAALTYLGKAAISPNGRCYVYEERAWLKTKINEWGSELKIEVDRENPRVIRLCQSSRQNRGEDNTIQQQVEAILERAVETTGNTPGSRISTKQLLHEFLRWKKKVSLVKEIGTYSEERALWILRNRGLIEYKAYLASFNPLPEETLPRLQLFAPNTNGYHGTPLMIDAIKACVYDKNKVEDVAEFNGDDPYDVARYIVDAVNRFTEEAVEEMEKFNRHNAIVAQLQQSNDPTSYYIGMRALETETDGSKPINRYHRGRH